jgi:NarL family two-component system response regulator LiaR
MLEQQQQPIRVMIVDDHMMVRDGLKVFLSIYPDITVVAEAADGEQALALSREHAPDVILMDILMPNIDGPTATAQIRQAFPQIQVIAVTSFFEEALVLRALQAGAIGYLLKDVHPDKLAAAIRDAHNGRATFAPALVHSLMQAVNEAPAAGHDLTKREREVLRLLMEGKTNSEIAAQLNISLGTARLHVSNILAKLGADNRTEAALLAVRHKLIP